jgi:hypothetical protein
MLRALGVVLLMAGPVAAEEWEVLRGGAVRDALAARVLGYADGATQNFFADGRTLYEKGSASWGRWRVEGDRYWSQWPPTDRWDCYGLARNGLDLRFTGEDGDQTVGRYIDLN